MSLLARREYSRAELARRLLARGAERDEVERVLSELEQRGYLSDARYAEAVVTQKVGRWSRRAIAHDLERRGVGRSAVRGALVPLAGADELAEATALWRRRFGRPPVDHREKSRQVRFLLSRGYSTEIAFKALRSAGVPDDGSEGSE